MKRILTVVVVALVMAAMMLAMAMPVLAQGPDPNANCIGERLASNQSAGPGSGGQNTAGVAQTFPGNVGISASNDCFS